jgi:DNA repair protein RadC
MNSGKEIRAKKKGKTSGEPPPRYHTRIKDWPLGEQPREKLLKRGVESLSDAELLAIIIGSGSRGVTALDLAQTLLREVGGLQALGEKEHQFLRQYKGIGRTRSITLVALFELSRRLQASGIRESPVITSPEDVAALFIPRYRGIQQERFYVIHLNSANRVIREVEISRGILNMSPVHPREVFHSAIIDRAASVILVHNHPSGNTEPSDEDRSVTRQIVESGRVLGIPVHDHVIIAGNHFMSFRSRNLM